MRLFSKKNLAFIFLNIDNCLVENDFLGSCAGAVVLLLAKNLNFAESFYLIHAIHHMAVDHTRNCDVKFK